MPSSGGASELVIQSAVGARISPDGNTILYGSGGKLLQRALAGGTATLVLPTIDNSYAPLWSPDGARILVTTTTPEQRDPEWWIVQTVGGEPRKTSLGADLRAQGFNYIATNAWLAGDWIIFTGRQGETQTLWKIQLGSDGKTVGKAVRATEDAQGDSGASFAAGKLVFSRTRVDMNFWALPLDPTGEHITASPEPLTSTPVRKGQQSAAGAKLLYSAENGDHFSLFLKDGAKETNLRDAFFSVIAPDGSRYVYGEGTKEQLNVYMKSLSWWSFWSSNLCQNCGMPRQFSPDGKKVLLWAELAADPAHRHARPCDADGQPDRVGNRGSNGSAPFTRRPLDQLCRQGWNEAVAGLRGSGVAGKAAQLIGLGAGHAGFRFVLLRVLVGPQRSDLHAIVARRRRKSTVPGRPEAGCRNKASNRRSNTSLRVRRNAGAWDGPGVEHRFRRRPQNCTGARRREHRRLDQVMNRPPWAELLMAFQRRTRL